MAGQRRVRIALSGGGTAGHVMPALAVAKALTSIAPEAELLYLGTATGLEAELVRRAGIEFAAIRVSAVSGRRGRQALGALARAARAVGEAHAVLRRFRPQAALGTGGYVAGPAMAAAWLSGVPVAIHEQNLRPGITNRWLARLAREIYVSYPETAHRFPRRKVIFTGYPVRPEIVAATRADGARQLGLDPARPTVLVTGGSLGSRRINQAVQSGLPVLAARLPQLQAVVLTGKQYYPAVRQSLADAGLLEGGRVVLSPFLHQMEHALAAADLVLSRAGGGAHELLVRGLPSVLVPSPNVAYDQQSDNARVLEAAGAARLIADRDLTGDALVDTLAELLESPQRLEAMAAAARAMGRPDAAGAIARRLLALAGRQAT